MALGLAGLLLGETQLTLDQLSEALSNPGTGPHQVVFDIRLPRTVAALVVGAALGLAGAVMQGLLRNPLADPGVLGVSGGAGLGAALAISLGLAVFPGAIEVAALGAALAVGLMLTWLAARFREPEILILFGVALSAFLGAMTSLVFNFSPSPVALSEVFSWLLGSVANRDWGDTAYANQWGMVGLTDPAVPLAEGNINNIYASDQSLNAIRYRISKSNENDRIIRRCGLEISSLFVCDEIQDIGYQSQVGSNARIYAYVSSSTGLPALHISCPNSFEIAV